MPSGHVIAEGGLTWATGTAVLLFETEAAYIIYWMYMKM